MDVRALLAELERLGSTKRRDDLGPRYGIHTAKAFGTTMPDIQAIARRTGRDPALAGALWKTGWLEARMLAAFVDDPAHVTPAQMDRWSADFDNWAVCDTACMHLFDRTPHAFAKVDEWARSRAEFVRRAIPPDHKERIKRYPGVTHKTLILVGDHDKMVGRAGGERLAKEMPNAQFCILDACGHAPQEDAPERVNTHLLDFFKA